MGTKLDTATACTAPLNRGFRSTILDAKQLCTQPYLGWLRNMVNEAYWDGHIDLIPRETGEPRFPSVEDVFSGLGAHGRCCLVFRDDDERMLKPVASAMIKYFNEDLGGVAPLEIGEEVGTTFSSSLNGSNGDEAGGAGCKCNIKSASYDTEPADLLDVEHWELTAVAILPDDPSLRKSGLAAHCTSMLEQDLRERLQAAELEKQGGPKKRRSGQADAVAPVSSSRTLTVWVRATIKTNVPYWQRRGYEAVRVDLYPQGFWGAIQNFQLMTLKKELARLDAASVDTQ